MTPPLRALAAIGLGVLGLSFGIPLENAGVVDAAPPFHHPHDVVNDVELVPNFPADPTVFCASAGTMNVFMVSKNRGFTWRNTRSGMRGSQVLQCAVAPDWETSKLVYVALGAGGLQRSRDGGQTWDPPLVRTAVEHVAIGPVTDSKRVLYYSSGRELWRSEDGGDSATRIGVASQLIRSIAIAPGAAGVATVAVASIDRRLFLSADDGASWSMSDLPGFLKSVKFSPDYSHDSTIWVCTHEAGLLRSTDAGRSFERVTGLPNLEVNDVAIAPSWPAVKDLFASTKTEGVFRSRDGGTTWDLTSLRIAQTIQTEDHYWSLRLSPTYPADPTIYCASFEGLYVSNDGGDNWYEHNVNPTRIGRMVEFSPNFAEDGRVFGIGYGNPIMASDDRGDTWSPICRQMKSMSTYSIGVSPTFAEDQLVMIGVNYGIVRSTDRGFSWSKIHLNPVVVDPRLGAFEFRQVAYSPNFANDRVVYAVQPGGLFRSDDAGLTWTGYEVPLEVAWKIEFSPDWTADQTMFLGGVSLRRSTDAGRSWGPALFSGRLLGIECAPDYESSGEVYAIARDKGFFRSTDKGQTWTNLANAFDGYSPSKMRMSPNFAKDGTLWVATLSGGMFVSNDRGLTWGRLLPLGSPLDTCFDMAMSPDYATDGTAFACVFEGILRTKDHGRTWAIVTKTEFYDDQRDPWILRGDDWRIFAYPGSLSYGANRTKRPDHKATMPFTGTGIALLGPRGPDHGEAEILLDGELVATIDCWSEELQGSTVLYEVHDLRWAYHDLTIRSLGTHSERSTDAWIGVDGALVDCIGPDKADVPVLAHLPHIYLTKDARYGRDTDNEVRNKAQAIEEQNKKK